MVPVGLPVASDSARARLSVPHRGTALSKNPSIFRRELPMVSRTMRRVAVLATALTLAPLTVSSGEPEGREGAAPGIALAGLCARGSCRPKPGWDCIIDGILVVEKCDTAQERCNATEE